MGFKATSRRRETTLRFFLIGIYTKVGCEKNETHFIERVLFSYNTIFFQDFFFQL